jgi:hypothetical protein
LDSNRDWRADLEAHAEQVYSQGGEDGVLRRIFERIGADTRSFVEFGAWDGMHWSNTANLRLRHGWTGLLLEGSDRADGELVKRERVDAENIEALFARYDVPYEFDLLSIDIDGNDYWVWKAITNYSPRVVIVEYNIFFQSEMAKTIAYDAGHVWDKTRHGLYHGASLAAFDKLAEEKGYRLVYTEPYCPNAIFVRADLIAADAILPSRAELSRWDWPTDGYAEPKPAPGGHWVDVG